MCVRGELWKSPHNVFLGGRWRGWTPKEGVPLWTSLIRFMSLNDRRGAEATSPLVVRSVQAGQRPVFCKRDFSPKPPSSMTQRSRRKPLLQKDGFCRRGFRPEPPSSMRQGSRRKTLPYRYASRIDLALPSLGHRFTQSHGRLPTGIPVSDHWKGRAKLESPERQR
jgi:hypothetical protein